MCTIYKCTCNTAKHYEAATIYNLLSEQERAFKDASILIVV